jgi:hypothetical protein
VKGAAGPSVSQPPAAVKETGHCTGDRRRPCGEVCEAVVLSSWRRRAAAQEATQERGALAVARARSGPGWARPWSSGLRPRRPFSWRGAVVGSAREATAVLAALGALATARTDLGPSGPIWNKAVAEATWLLLARCCGFLLVGLFPLRRRPDGLAPSLPLHLPEGQRWPELLL